MTVPFMLAILILTSPHGVSTFSQRRARVCRTSSRRRTPSVVVSVKIKLREFARVCRFTQDCQQHSRTALLHLHWHAEGIQRAFFQQPVHHVAKHLRIQIIEARFQHRDRLRCRLCGDSVRRGFAYSQSHHIRMSRKVARPRAIA